MDRKSFLTSLLGVPALAATGMTPPGSTPAAAKKIKPSLNAYSFNAPLMAGQMTVADMLAFCSEAGFEGVDITGYYLSGYPAPPPDDYLYAIKRKAFRLGVGISGTGVRNDLTIADPVKRAEEVALVKNWVEVAAKLGAPVLRIFAGSQKNEGVSPATVTDWMLKDILTCVEYGKQHGVIIGIQNHNDFIQTAEQVTHMIEEINSEWFGLILDTGSYRVHDPYEEIAASLPYAINWQLKEKIFVNGVETDTDVDRIVNMIKASSYHGYLPIESLGNGDPKPKILAMLARLQKAIG